MTTDSRDIVERLEELKANLSHGDLSVLEDMLGTVTEAISLIKFLRKVAGAAAVGASFADIAKDLLRREPSSGMQAGPYVGVFRGLNDT